VQICLSEKKKLKKGLKWAKNEVFWKLQKYLLKKKKILLVPWFILGQNSMVSWPEQNMFFEPP